LLELSKWRVISAGIMFLAMRHPVPSVPDRSDQRLKLSKLGTLCRIGHSQSGLALLHFLMYEGVSHSET
jgi:hypothetical protein